MNCWTKHSNHRTKIIAYVKGNMGSFTARKLFFILFFCHPKVYREYFRREMGITPLWCFPAPSSSIEPRDYLDIWRCDEYFTKLNLSNGNRPTQRWIFHQLLLLFKYRDGSQTLPSGDLLITIFPPGFHMPSENIIHWEEIVAQEIQSITTWLW